jgi:hypothetical protein
VGVIKRCGSKGEVLIRPLKSLGEK